MDTVPLMVAGSHAYWTWRVARRRDARHPLLAAVGAVLPDVPAAVAGIAARGAPREELLDRVYHRSPWREVHLAFHSAVPALAASLLARRSRRARALMAGYLGHLAVDYALHADDAWPPLWPLSGARFRSPVSYWQRDRHALAWGHTELALMALSVVRDRGAVGRATGAVALAAAVVPVTGGYQRMRQT